MSHQHRPTRTAGRGRPLSSRVFLRAVVVWALGAGAVAGCDLLESSPPAGMLQMCWSDGDCRPGQGFRCLPCPPHSHCYPAFFDPDAFHPGPVDASVEAGGCSMPCDTADDCPTVRTNHCGDMTTCINHVCGYNLCD